jgi:hypothetical protein
MSGLPSLSRMVIRALEIAGAGLTSAVVAYLIGRFGAPAPATPPAPPPPAIVHLAPADEEMMRSVRSDQAALLDQLRSDSQARKTPAVIVVPSAPAAVPTDAPAAGAAAKPAKSAPPVARKEQKPERTHAVDAKPRVEPGPAPLQIPAQPLQIQPPISAAADAAPRSAGQPAVTAAPTTVPAPPAQSDSKLASAFRWLLPSRDRAPENVPPASVPRPPKPVGEFLPSEM